MMHSSQGTAILVCSGLTNSRKILVCDIRYFYYTFQPFVYALIQAAGIPHGHAFLTLNCQFIFNKWDQKSNEKLLSVFLIPQSHNASSLPL